MEVELFGNELMRPEIFGSGILQACGGSARCRRMDLLWPEDSITQGKSEPGLEKSRENFDSTEVVASHAAGAAGPDGLRRSGFHGDLWRCEFASEKFANKPVGVIGIGVISKLSVPLLQVFDRRIIACDPYSGLLTIDTENHCVDSGELDEMLEHSCTATLRSRVGPDTDRMIRENEFAMMAPDAFFVNTARDAFEGKNSPHGAIAERRLSRAGLDAFAVEPSPRHMSFLRFRDLAFAPNTARDLKKTVRIAFRRAAAEVRRLMAGTQLENPC